MSGFFSEYVRELGSQVPNVLHVCPWSPVNPVNYYSGKASQNEVDGEWHTQSRDITPYWPVPPSKSFWVPTIENFCPPGQNFRLYSCLVRYNWCNGFDWFGFYFCFTLGYYRHLKLDLCSAWAYGKKKHQISKPQSTHPPPYIELFKEQVENV